MFGDIVNVNFMFFFKLTLLDYNIKQILKINNIYIVNAIFLTFFLKLSGILTNDLQLNGPYITLISITLKICEIN